MKKTIGLFIGLIVMLSNSMTILGNQVGLEKTYMSAEEKKDVFGDVENLQNAIVYIANDVQEAKRIFNLDTSKEEYEQFNQGFIKVEEIIYVLEDSSDVSTFATPSTKIVVDVATYNKPSKVLSSSSWGMRHWLDVIFNLELGSKTKIAWRAATILGINPSNFLSEWQKGDMLEESQTKIVRDKWIQVKGRSGSYVNAGRARKEDVTIYLDLRTSKKVNGELTAYRNSDDKTYVCITKNYNSDSKLKSLTLSYAVLDGEVISFYEDPWIK